MTNIEVGTPVKVFQGGRGLWLYGRVVEINAVDGCILVKEWADDIYTACDWFLPHEVEIDWDLVE